MKKLAAVCIERPVFAAMLIMCLVVVGTASYMRLGVDRFQALVTPPQASVLALGSIKRRPTAVPGGVGVALTLTAGVTIDHRVADGAHAATLLDRFVAHLG